MARRNFDRIVIQMKGIADHLRRRLGVPGNNADGIGVRLHIDVDGAVAHRRGFPHITAVDGQREDFLGDPQPARSLPLHEFLRRQDLAPGRSRHVGHQAFHLADLVVQ